MVDIDPSVMTNELLLFLVSRTLLLIVAVGAEVKDKNTLKVFQISSKDVILCIIPFGLELPWIPIVADDHDVQYQYICS